MEFYIILVFLLFIAGVSSTFVYDHFKKQIAEHGGFFKAKPSKKPTPTRKKTVKFDEVSANKQFEEAFQKKMNQLAKSSKSKSKPKQTKKIKPNSIVAKLYRDGDIPEEILYTQELSNDFSVNNQTMTFEEFINKLEKMKK